MFAVGAILANPNPRLSLAGSSVFLSWVPPSSARFVGKSGLKPVVEESRQARVRSMSSVKGAVSVQALVSGNQASSDGMMNSVMGTPRRRCAEL